MADKKLFEQPIELPESQGMTNRIAFGRAGNATKNMTFNDLVSWLNGKLSFLKPSNNLNDVANKASARNNLNVYSKSETYSKSEVDYQVNQMDNKLGGIQILVGGYITWSNSSPYVSWNTAFGSLTISVQYVSTGKIRINHNLGSYSHQTIAFVDSSSFVGGAEHRKIGQINRGANFDEINISNADHNLNLIEGQNVFVMIIGF